MKRRPRDRNEPLFSRNHVLYSILQGLVVFTVVLARFMSARFRGLREEEARAQSYTTLIIANLGLVLRNRSRTRTILATLKNPNKALWFVVGGATVFLGVVLTVPLLQQVFRFAPLSLLDVGMCLVAGVLGILGFELVKFRPREPRNC